MSDGAHTGVIDLDLVLAAARRQAKVIIGAIAVCILLGGVYLSVAVKKYTGSADILIDGRTFGQLQNEQAGLVFNTSAIDSQVEVIKSQRVAIAVIRKLNLTNDPEFVGRSFVAKIFSWLLSRPFDVASSEDVEDEKAALERKAEMTFAKQLNVKRVDKTFVITVDFLSRDPDKAARIANAIADAYLLDQLDSKYEAARRASGWLQERITELRQKSIKADLAVQKFREKNNLITTGGRLINDQQLTELNSQLTSARAERARAEARYDRIQTIIKERQMDAAVSEALTSPVINDLRTKYLTASKRLAELMARLGPSHVQVIALQQEVKDYENQIFGELSRISESYKSDVDIARAREQAISDGLNRLVDTQAGDNRVLVELRDMEREAETYRGLYQTFLQRNQELVQQQSYPVTEARVISRANRPISASQPRPLIVMAISLIGGIAVGTGLGMLREYRDRAFRTGEQVRTELGVEFLGLVPLQSAEELDQPPTMQGTKLPSVPPIMQFAVAHPLSRFADTLRTVKVALDLEQPSGKARVIGVASAVSGEGKSAISSNLAMVFGSTGARTLLIDGDLRRCGLSRGLRANAERGLADVVMNKASLSSVVSQIEDTNVWLLASPPDTRMANSSQILGSPAMGALIEMASKHFDYIVIDLPPLGALVDGRAIEPYLGSYLMVVHWGDTPRATLREILEQNAAVNAKCIGAILNKADPTSVGHYLPKGGYSYSYAPY
jgi:succinoglycan biosynthesis transport protein ExoP